MPQRRNYPFYQIGLMCALALGSRRAGDVSPLIVIPAIIPFNLCVGAYLHAFVVLI